MLILIKPTVKEIPDIKYPILLLISLPQGSILRLLQPQKLILHINTLLIFDNDSLVIRIMPLILEPTQLLDINLLARLPFMNLHPVNLQLIRSLECYKLLVQAVLFHTKVM
jgi:hypothetical protein